MPYPAVQAKFQLLQALGPSRYQTAILAGRSPGRNAPQVSIERRISSAWLLRLPASSPSPRKRVRRHSVANSAFRSHNCSRSLVRSFQPGAVMPSKTGALGNASGSVRQERGLRSSPVAFADPLPLRRSFPVGAKPIRSARPLLRFNRPNRALFARV
jgi:hypothetical protein